MVLISVSLILEGFNEGKPGLLIRISINRIREQISQSLKLTLQSRNAKHIIADVLGQS